MLSSMVHLYLMHQGKFLIDIPLASCHCTVDMEPDPDIYIKQKNLLLAWINIAITITKLKL